MSEPRESLRGSDDVKDKRAAEVADHMPEYEGPGDAVLRSRDAQEVLAATYEDKDYEVALEPLSQWQLAWRRA